MILQSWQIASEHITRRWWWVRVHDSPASMCRAAHAYAPHHGWAYWKPAAILGCCQPGRPLIEIDDDPDNPQRPLLWPSYGFAGVIRLTAENLFPEVVHHEVLHAACHTYRMNVELSLQLGNGYGDMDREEDLAYIHGQLAADMDTKLQAWCA